MGHVDLAHVSYFLPDGRALLYEVSFRVGDGAKTALLGANGTGKTTLLRLIAGDLEPAEGTIVRSGGLGVMRQFIGSVRDATTVRGFLAAMAPPAIRAAAERLEAAEQVAAGQDEAAQLAYAQAIADWTDVGGWDAEVLWETCIRESLGLTLADAGHRPVSTLSGGEQKRLALEALLRGPDEVLLLDEPDNYLDVPAKRWLEERLQKTPKTVLYVSHDRELIAETAQRIVTVEAHTVWTHGGRFATYHEARADRIARLEELRRRWDEEHERLNELVRTLRVQASISPDMASRYRAMCTRLEKFEEAGPPPEIPRDQPIKMRLKGGRTGVRAITVEQLELTGLMQPFSVEVFYGERVGVLGCQRRRQVALPAAAGRRRGAPHGRLEARCPGRARPLRADAPPPDLERMTPVDVLMREALERGQAMGALTRYGLGGQALQPFETLSGGQQARLQILLLELGGATMLLLDEPTDNLDLESAEALEEALEVFDGTVVAVTHDRWFARGFDRFLVFGSDGKVFERPSRSGTRPARIAETRLEDRQREPAEGGQAVDLGRLERERLVAGHGQHQLRSVAERHRHRRAGGRLGERRAAGLQARRRRATRGRRSSRPLGQRAVRDAVDGPDVGTDQPHRRVEQRGGAAIGVDETAGLGHRERRIGQVAVRATAEQVEVLVQRRAAPGRGRRRARARRPRPSGPRGRGSRSTGCRRRRRPCSGRTRRARRAGRASSRAAASSRPGSARRVPRGDSTLRVWGGASSSGCRCAWMPHTSWRRSRDTGWAACRCGRSSPRCCTRRSCSAGRRTRSGSPRSSASSRRRRRSTWRGTLRRTASGSSARRWRSPTRRRRCWSPSSGRSSAGWRPRAWPARSAAAGSRT